MQIAGNNIHMAFEGILILRLYLSEMRKEK
jgi:hypothetical protein